MNASVASLNFLNKQSFFLGFRYIHHQKRKFQLLNLVFGQAKMAVYISREKMVEDGFTVEPVIVCVSKIKSRLLTDFNFQQNNWRSGLF